MLQQTRVEVVVDYFERWMSQFPTIRSVADASTESIIKAWEGLGYYSRARNIHAAAKQVNGELPQTYEELIALKGFGEYTTGAVLSFAFQKKHPAIDGNVTRVLSRLFAIDEEISTASAKKKIQKLAWDLLPDEQPWEIVEALIELGALVCKKVPACGLCPLRLSCKGYAEGIADTLPIKKAKLPTVRLDRSVAVIESSEGILVRQETEQKLMADLWEFPYRDRPFDWQSVHPKLVNGQELPKCHHTFTRYKAELYPIHFVLETPIHISGFTWISRDRILELPFSSGHKKVLGSVLNRKIQV